MTLAGCNSDAVNDGNSEGEAGGNPDAAADGGSCVANGSNSQLEFNVGSDGESDDGSDA